MYENVPAIKTPPVTPNRAITNFLFIPTVKYIVISDENTAVIVAKSIGECPLYIAGIKIFIIKAIVTIKANKAFNPFFLAIKRTRIINPIPIIYNSILLSTSEI